MSHYSDLIRQAQKALEFAHAPYSHFSVGAAVSTDTGKVIKGCNVENSSYGLSMCAERIAIFKAISEGENKFQAVAIVSSNGKLCPPCGACRQVLWDLAGDIDVVMQDENNKIHVFKLSKLLPYAFDQGFLPNEQ